LRESNHQPIDLVVWSDHQWFDRNGCFHPLRESNHQLIDLVVWSNHQPIDLVVQTTRAPGGA
jgi:hypothetical protein